MSIEDIVSADSANTEGGVTPVVWQLTGAYGDGLTVSDGIAGYSKSSLYVGDYILVCYIIYPVFHNDCIRDGMIRTAYIGLAATMSDGDDTITTYKAAARYRIFSTCQRYTIIYF